MKRIILGATLIGLLSFPTFTAHAVTFSDIAHGNFTMVYQFRNETHYTDNNVEVINGFTRTPEIIVKVYQYTETYNNNFVLIESVHHYYYDLDKDKIEFSLDEVSLINGVNGKVLQKDVRKKREKVAVLPGKQVYMIAMHAFNLATQSGQLKIPESTF